VTVHPNRFTHATTISGHLERRHRSQMNRATLLFHFRPISTPGTVANSRKKPENRLVFGKIFPPLFSLDFSSIQSSMVLRPSIRNRRDPFRVKQRGTTC
ncbi:unnamed protein product, partial [Prunus brigantina]